ncbi:MAG: hypothetical protein OXG16_04135 [Rhodospirillales bacterium]|nr:hypothetical protein [Rhodospirillales bacterium]
MAATSTNLHNELIQAGFDPKQATVLAHAIAAPPPPAAPTWPVPVIAAVLVAAIGIVGAGVYQNGDRIDANRDRIDAVQERLTEVETGLSGRLSTFEASVSERLTRIETLLEERLPAGR